VERCPGGSSLWSGACPSGEFAIQQRFTLNIDQFRSRFPPLCQPKTLRVAETMTQALFWDTATHPEQPSAVAERYHDRDHQRVAPGEWFTLQQQVLVNLLMNAMDALAETPPAHRRVSITTEVRAADVEFTVRDTGTGLPAKINGTLFTPFVTSKASGLGIGLAVVRTIVDAHDGTIVARNHPDGGAAFTVTLRRSAAASVADALH
jgi:C4-dicarboxylate-specific signal transduction histidine kinase